MISNGQKAGLDLSTPEGAAALLKDGKRAIVPGNLSKSEFYHRLVTTDPDLAMPTKASNRTLTDYERAVLIKWIEQGAVYKPHWAFIAPVKPALPEVKEKDRANNPIDYFVLQKLQENKLEPSPEADKETLLRRVTLDLTGLPPTVEEIEAFVADHSKSAYEKVVDKLLQSPHYGEKMAADWLDVSRYADTYGYTVDRYRATWQWRDWVIKPLIRICISTSLQPGSLLAICCPMLPVSKGWQQPLTGIMRKMQRVVSSMKNSGASMWLTGPAP